MSIHVTNECYHCLEYISIHFLSSLIFLLIQKIQGEREEEEEIVVQQKYIYIYIYTYPTA